MAEMYQQSTQEADAMFKQSADKFADGAGMKQMASEMHNELEATRDELRRGVLEMPQEAAGAPRRCARSLSTRSRPLAN